MLCYERTNDGQQPLPVIASPFEFSLIIMAPAQNDDDGASIVASGFVKLFGSQLVTRIFTFFLNLITARSLSPAAYGVAVVQFHLFNTTILFLAREGFRRGCLRIHPNMKNATGKVLSIASMTIPLGTVLAILVTLLVLKWNKMADSTEYQTAVYMQGIAAVVELLSEPFYILSSVNLWFGLRVWSETAAMIAKNALTLLLLYRKTIPVVIAFSWGQLAYATVLVFIYGFGFYWNQSTRRTTGDIQKRLSFALDKQVLRMCGIFSLQAAGKLVLAEGSKAVLAVATPPNEQGVYGLVNNLGSLVVRTIFQPFEEVVFVAFSRPLAPPASGHTPTVLDRLREHVQLLRSLCRSISLLGAMAAAFGPAYSQLVLSMLYGPKWCESGAPRALAFYSGYIALLAVNGTLEAFVHGVSDQRGLHRANTVLAAMSVVHIILGVVGVRYGGAMGLLLADAANMLFRIMYCLKVAAAYFAPIGGFHIPTLFPSWQTQLSLLVSFVITLISKSTNLALVHVAIGGGCLCLVLIVAHRQHEVQGLLGLVVSKRKQSQGRGGQGEASKPKTL